MAQLGRVLQQQALGQGAGPVQRWGPVRLLLPLVRVALVLRTVLAWLQRLKRRKPHAAP